MLADPRGFWYPHQAVTRINQPEVPPLRVQWRYGGMAQLQQLLHLAHTPGPQMTGAAQQLEVLDAQLGEFQPVRSPNKKYQQVVEG